MVTFKCLTSYSQTELIVSLFLLPTGVDRTVVQDGGELPEGRSEVNVTFLATEEVNETTARCSVTNEQTNQADTAEALLLIQGKLMVYGNGL